MSNPSPRVNTPEQKKKKKIICELQCMHRMRDVGRTRPHSPFATHYFCFWTAQSLSTPDPPIEPSIDHCCQRLPAWYACAQGEVTRSSSNTGRQQWGYQRRVFYQIVRVYIKFCLVQPSICCQTDPHSTYISICILVFGNSKKYFLARIK